MNPIAKIFLVVVIILAALCLGFVLYNYIDVNYLVKRRSEKYKEWHQDGYRQAVDDIIKGGSFVDYETKYFKYVDIAAIDGELTDYWDKKFEEYAAKGFNASMDTLVEHGVINKRTGDKFKYRYAESRKAKKEHKE